MSMSEHGAEELRLVRARFRKVAAAWRLEPVEMAGLLGMPDLPQGCDPSEVSLSEDGETRMRLVIEAARELDALFEAEDLLDWLRDDEDDEITPLTFMSRGPVEIRAMRAAAAARAAS